MAADAPKPTADDTGNTPVGLPRRRRPVLIPSAVVLIVLFAGIEFMLLGAYRETSETNAKFSASTATTTSLADAQHNALLLKEEVAFGGYSAESLGTGLRPSDEVARLGGDEFAVLLAGRDADTAAGVASRLVGDLARPIAIRGQHVTLGGSAGLALSDATHLEADDLLRDADLAMYAAKRAGKGACRIFDPVMRTELDARQALEGDLERALVEDDFRLHYQPVLDLGSGSMVGVEALVRWEHPDEGLLLPGRFLDAAEETGLITPLGDWVLDTACRQERAWHDTYGERAPWVSVNLSPRQLGRDELVDEVKMALDAHGTPPELLVLEISERVMATQARESAAMLERLRGLGVRLALDDFGAGQASLMQVRFLPLDILKLDRSFVDAVDRDHDSHKLAESVLRLAEGVGITTVAEGIETEAQLNTLRALGFHMGQGFYSGRPGAAKAIDALLAAPQTGTVFGASAGPRLWRTRVPASA